MHSSKRLILGIIFLCLLSGMVFATTKDTSMSAYVGKNQSFVCSYTKGNCTKLSLIAKNIREGMSQQLVILLLGKPTWVILPQDKSEDGTYDTPVSLLWKNGKCTPVSVDFNINLKVTGVDAGLICCYDNSCKATWPSSKCKCSNSDRTGICNGDIKLVKNNLKKYESIEVTKAPKSIKDGQYWVEFNISGGTKWDYSFWKKKFGTPIALDVTKDWNPNIIAVYYFKSIDMSIMVNKLKGEIETWRIGQQTR